MKLLTIFAWGAFALAAVAVIATFALEAPMLIASVIVLIAAGAIFLALDRALTLLTDIRGALVEGDRQLTDLPTAVEADPAKEPTAIRSASELADDLARMKARLGQSNT